MKKHLFLLGLALMACINAFASRDVVPSDQVLAEYYNPGQLCVCIYVSEDMACNDIVFTGTYNGWSSVISQCAKFQQVEGYDGWYVVAVTDENADPESEYGRQGKPIMADIDGNFSWDYQIGAATVIRGNVQAVKSPYMNEIDLIQYGTDAPNVYTVDAWKSNPCTAIYHNYTITVISDGCNGAVVPFVVGGMNNWTFTQMQLDAAKTAANGIPTYTYTFKAVEGTQYQIVSGVKDTATGEIIDQPAWNDDAYNQT